MLKPHRLVMIPGPTPVVRSIQDQMGRETIAFGDPDFIEDFKSVVRDLKELWQCSGQAFVLAGSGTLAMEMAIANISKAGDKQFGGPVSYTTLPTHRNGPGLLLPPFLGKKKKKNKVN